MSKIISEIIFFNLCLYFKEPDWIFGGKLFVDFLPKGVNYVENCSKLVWYGVTPVLRSVMVTQFLPFEFPPVTRYYMSHSFCIFSIPIYTTILHICTWYQTNLLLTLIIGWYLPHTWCQSKKHQPCIKNIKLILYRVRWAFFVADLVETCFNIKTLLHLKHNPPVTNITN